MPSLRLSNYGVLRAHLEGAGVANSTGFIEPGIYNTARMAGLMPGTRYYYIYGDEVINS